MRALVVGGAHSVWRDIYAVESAVGPWDGLVIAVNDIGTVLPRLDLWATLHPEKLDKWVRQRRENGLADAVTWSHAAGADHVLTGWSNGSSGLLAVGVALYLGCEEVVLCGVRMDGQRNHFRDEIGWRQFKNYRRGWESRLGVLRGRVTSVSGWTRDVLGAPAFLAETQST